MKNILKKALVMMLVAVMTVSNMSGIVIKAADNRPEKININPDSKVMQTCDSNEKDAYGNVIGKSKDVVYRSGESIFTCYNLDGTLNYVQYWPNFLKDQDTYHMQYYFKDGSIKSDETKKSDGSSTCKEYNEKGTLIKKYALDKDGKYSILEYDEKGNLIKEYTEDKDGRRSMFEYDENGKCILDYYYTITKNDDGSYVEAYYGDKDFTDKQLEAFCDKDGNQNKFIQYGFYDGWYTYSKVVTEFYTGKDYRYEDKYYDEDGTLRLRKRDGKIVWDGRIRESWNEHVTLYATEGMEARHTGSTYIDSNGINLEVDPPEYTRYYDDENRGYLSPVTWSVEDKTIAKVTKNGRVYGLKAGKQTSSQNLTGAVRKSRSRLLW